MSSPLVSICIPTYNGMKFIEETMECAVNQDYDNIEIVICDDHSTDGTFEFCRKYAEHDSRVRVVKNEQNVGLVQNWINSIEHASGVWIKFLFQDDLMENHTVRLMVEKAFKHDVSTVVCDREYFFEDGYDEKDKRMFTIDLPQTSKIFPECRAYDPHETALRIAPHFFHNCIGEPPCFLFKKNKFQPSDMPLDFKQLIDYVFILRKIMTESFVYIPSKLVKFRVHRASESNKNALKNFEDQKALHNFLYVRYYERLLLCFELIHNEIFEEILKYIPRNHIKVIKDFTMIYSYRKYGFNQMYNFYNLQKISEYLFNFWTNSYNYYKYKIYKILHKRTIKRYRL